MYLTALSGGTLSSLVIIDEKGTPLTEVKGPDTNHWVIMQPITIIAVISYLDNDNKNHLPR